MRPQEQAYIGEEASFNGDAMGGGLGACPSTLAKINFLIRPNSMRKC